MRPEFGMFRRSSPGSICTLLFAVLVLSWSWAYAQQSFAPIYRAGVSDSPVAAAATDPSVSLRFRYVVAGDVRAPGVFYTDRETVTAGELIERAGGSSSFYEPMVHRISGIRVVETLCQGDASQWELSEGEMLRIVGSRGVRDARVEPLTTITGSHVVCLGLAQFPVLIQLPDRRTTLNDLFDIVGQSPELAGSTLVLPVRIYPGGTPQELDPGTLVIFPSDKVNQHSIPAGVLTPSAPLDPEMSVESYEQIQTPFAESTTLSPDAIDRSIPALLPSQSAPLQPETSPLLVPATASGPTASTVPFVGGSSPVHEAAITQRPVQTFSNTHEIELSHSVVAADVSATPSPRQSIRIDNNSEASTIASIETSKPASDLSQVALYTAGLAVVCLSLAGAWTFWERMRSIATSQSFTRQTAVHADTPAKRATSRVDHVQALIDNRVPIIEETVETPRPRQFQGEAWGQRRLRLDSVQPLAGPHAVFHAQQAGSRASQEASTNFEQPVHSAADARQLQRVMALLAAEQTRTTRRRPLVPADGSNESDALQPAEESSRTRGSSLERALKQVMRKSRS